MAKENSVKKTKVVDDAHALGFFGKFDKHLKELDWNKTDFKKAVVEKMGDYVSAAQLSRWAYGQRSVSRGMAIRAAVIITLEYEKRRREGKGRALDPLVCLDNLDTVIQDFLNRAGYPGNLRILPPSDFIWEEINGNRRDRKLKIGYTHCPPWAKEGIGSESGFSIEIARRIMTLLGFKIEFVKMSWGEMPAAIRERRVDLIAPLLMNLPSRLYEFGFSTPLSKEIKISFGIKFIVAKSFFSGSAQSFDDLITGYSLGYVEGEVGEAARAMLQSNVEVVLDDLEAGVNWVLDGVSSNENRIFAYEKRSCETIVSQSKWQEQLATLSPPPPWEKIEFQICFGAHPDESKLIHAINECISLQFLQEYIKEEFQKINPSTV